MIYEDLARRQINADRWASYQLHIRLTSSEHALPPAKPEARIPTTGSEVARQRVSTQLTKTHTPVNHLPLMILQASGRRCDQRDPREASCTLPLGS